MTRLVQLQNAITRGVALVQEPHLRLLPGADSVYRLVETALRNGNSITDLVHRNATGERLDYDAVYDGRSPWRLLVPVDHPDDPARCLVSGTGLTHLGSAQNRDAMHGKSDAELTDSMKMFRAGLEGGRPNAGCIGTAPEWFYKGTGGILRAHREPLDVPGFAEDGGEEAEIAGIYLIDADGRPWRLGMTAGNEFSDHKFERTNYLNLAGSKLRTCAIGPELVVDPEFESVAGTVSIERAGREIWSKHIATGAAEMCHSLANLEHHHFKFDAHRRPGDLHVHFYGAHSLSFADEIELTGGDEMVIHFAGFGRALRNPVRVADTTRVPVVIHILQSRSE
jgi:hypothetical protein